MNNICRNIIYCSFVLSFILLGILIYYYLNAYIYNNNDNIAVYNYRLYIENNIANNNDKDIDKSNTTNPLKDIFLSTHNQLQDNTDNNVANVDSVDNIDCILKIPSIDLEKPIYNGDTRLKSLEEYELITASSDMKYINGGNYIICGHASKLYGHSLNRLKELKKGDSIQIESFSNIFNYIITEVTYADSDHSKDHFYQTNESTITIVSCAKNISEKGYIIIHAKIFK